MSGVFFRLEFEGIVTSEVNAVPPVWLGILEMKEGSPGRLPPAFKPEIHINGAIWLQDGC